MKIATPRWYLLGILFLLYVFNIIDRHIINILVEPVKRDLALGDAEIGFLTGFAFALFYTVMGVPIGLLADRYNRTRLIAACSALWSVMTALTGTATGFVSAAIARMGVGIGEAGLTPAANSLIGDMYRPSDRGKAIGIYISAVPIGTMLAGLLGGWLEAAAGWRMTFIVFGAAGLLLTLIFMVTFREPVRGAFDEPQPASERDKVSILETTKFLLSRRSCRYFFPGFAVFGFVGAAINNWTPAFFMRTHETPLMQMAVSIGTISGIGGAIGMIAGGMMADHFSTRNVAAYLKVPAQALLITLPLYLGVYMSASAPVAAALLVVPVFTGAVIVPPALALLQRLVRHNMRAVAVAVFLLVLHLAGMGLGPLAVGGISDLLAPIAGPDSLRYALIIVIPLNLIAVFLFWRGAAFISSDLELGSSAVTGGAPRKDHTVDAS